jgi:hypothetical protein
VTAQGSTYSRLRRALDRSNLTEALSAAADLPHVGLTEALELVLLVCDRAPEKFGRAALCWHRRYCREAGEVTLEDGQASSPFSPSCPLDASRPPQALSDVLYRRDLERACEALNSWARRSG